MGHFKMFLFIIGLFLTIAGAAAIDTPAELLTADYDSTIDWLLFTLFTAIGLPVMFAGILQMRN
jgi:hypothetical protein